MHRSRIEGGFSLIELLIVTGIAAMLMMFAAEGFVAAATRSQARAVTVEIGGILRTARQAALTERHPVQITFDAAGTKLHVVGAEPYGLGLYDFSGTGVSIGSITGGPLVTFYPSGRSASPTTIQVMSRHRDTWRITVSLTGRVNLS